MIRHFILVIFKTYFAALCVASSAFAQNPTQKLTLKPQSCSKIFQTFPMTAIDPFKGDLLNRYQKETDNLMTSEIIERNNRTVVEFQKQHPQPALGRADHIPFSMAWDLLKSIENHPQIMRGAGRLQSRDDSFGFCFGRAMYFHLALLKMGLQKESIKKIWIIGGVKARQSENIVWDFHVATVAFTKEKGWVTLDTNEVKPEPVEHWVNSYLSRSVDGRARIYVTSADRFTAEINRYDRLQLGLDLQKNEDLYKGYFQKLLSTIANLNLKVEGLAPLERLESLSQVSQAQEQASKKSREIKKKIEKDEKTSFLKDFFGF